MKPAQMASGNGRREFLKKALLASASASLSVTSFSQERLTRTGSSKKVVIIGAGMAGLSAGYELMQAGHDVTILEAQMRPGGRVRTIRAPFADGLYAEAGAMFVNDTQDFTIKYAKQFGLTLEPSGSPSGASVYHVRGRRILLERGMFGSVEWPMEFSAEEKRAGPYATLAKHIEAVSVELASPASDAWPPDSLKQYDLISFGQFFRVRGVSPDLVTLSGVNFYDVIGEGIDSYSALSVLPNEVLSLQSNAFYVIKGGSDQLPKAFAASMSERVRYGAAVKSIQHRPEGVRVSCVQSGMLQEIAADHLICAIPFSVLKDLSITPLFSSEKMRAIRELAYTSVTRGYVQMKERFWTRDKLLGTGATDLPVQRLRDYTAASNQQGVRGILESYLTGQRARNAAALTEERRNALLLEHTEKVFPGIRNYAEGVAWKIWDADEWARGGYSWFKPGQLTSIGPHIALPEGRVHFAGEHTSRFSPEMQGALESGNRAAREVNEAQ